MGGDTGGGAQALLAAAHALGERATTAELRAHKTIDVSGRG
jgi:hypothetical protein